VIGMTADYTVDPVPRDPRGIQHGKARSIVLKSLALYTSPDRYKLFDASKSLAPGTANPRKRTSRETPVLANRKIGGTTLLPAAPDRLSSKTVFRIKFPSFAARPRFTASLRSGSRI
jgi:hypothetical protein